MNNIEKKIYEVMDSFLTEAKDQNGKDRSLSQLNTDRHLFVKKMEEILKEQREDIVKEIEKVIEYTIMNEHKTDFELAQNMYLRMKDIINQTN